MNTQLVSFQNGSFIECFSDGQLLENDKDFLDIISVCGEHLCARLLVHAALLPDEFYDLKTGLAGELLQKLVNYRINAAFIVEAEKAGKGRFNEMMIETNRGWQFFFCHKRDAAVDWLIKNNPGD